MQREFCPGEWEVLRARASALELVRPGDQEPAFSGWMRARLKEWVQDGILDVVSEIDGSTRGAAGEAPEPED